MNRSGNVERYNYSQRVHILPVAGLETEPGALRNTLLLDALEQPSLTIQSGIVSIQCRIVRAGGLSSYQMRLHVCWGGREFLAAYHAS